MSDLTVTQLLLEVPEDSEQGTVNGVQNALNKLMDIIKNVMVILLPWPQTFGYLIMVSWAFVFSGGVLFAAYTWRMHSHLFHFGAYMSTEAKHRQVTPEMRYSTSEAQWKQDITVGQIGHADIQTSQMTWQIKVHNKKGDTSMQELGEDNQQRSRKKYACCMANKKAAMR